MFAIEVKNLSKNYKDKTVLNNISFNIKQGIIFGILGENGAGKTTLCSILTKHNKKSSGEITYFGQKNIRDEKIGLQYQSENLYENLKIKEIVDLYSSFYNLDKDYYEHYYNKLEIPKLLQYYPKQLSEGNRKRVKLFLSIFHNPDLVFLDEPTTGLDPKIRLELWEIIKQLKKEGKTIILVTHYLEEVKLLCDEVIFMKDGNILEEGTVKDINDKYFSLKKITLVDYTVLDNSINIKYNPDKNNHIYTNNVSDTLKDIISLEENNIISYTDLSVESTNLDDLYFKIIN